MDESPAPTGAPVPQVSSSAAPLPVTELQEEAPRPPRWRRLTSSASAVLGVLLTPLSTVPRLAREGKYGAPLLVAVLAALLAAGVIGGKQDFTRQVAPPEAPGMGPGAPRGAARAMGAAPQATISDRELAEQAAKAKSVARTKLALGAGLLLPFQLFLLAIGLFLLARYVGGTPTMAGTMAAACCGALPLAIKDVIAAVAAWRAEQLLPGDVKGLVAPGDLAPAGPGALARLLSGVDPWLLWSVALVGLGLASAAAMSKRRSYATLLVAFLCFLAVTRVIMGGAPTPPGGPR